MYPKLLADLEKAEKFIFLEYFIVRSGKMWSGVEEILMRKAAQGVDVRLIYDDFGSLLGLPKDFVVRMERNHIRCIPFNPVVPLVSVVMNHRDHRKIVVVDGSVAYTGGVNLADEYINAENALATGKMPPSGWKEPPPGVLRSHSSTSGMRSAPVRRIIPPLPQRRSSCPRLRTGWCSPTRTARWTRKTWLRRFT